MNVWSRACLACVVLMSCGVVSAEQASGGMAEPEKVFMETKTIFQTDRPYDPNGIDVTVQIQVIS